MFGIRVESEFLDLAQSRFSISLKSTLYFDSSSNDAVPGSLLISTKAPLSKRNIRILNKAHVLTNPEPFLNQKMVEIFANGSAIYRGLLSVTEATQSDISLTIHINSPAALKDFTLQDVDLQEFTSQHALYSCNDSINIFDTMPFVCPTIYAPNQWGGDEVPDFQSHGFQNLWENNEIRFAEGAPVVPMVKIAAILRGAFAKVGFTLSNDFDNSLELRQLLLHYANPVYANGDWRFTDVKLKRHVPKMVASDLVKYFVRFFNQGLFIDGFESDARITSAEATLSQITVLDWTKYVRKRYTIREKNRTITKFSMPLPDYLSDMFTLKQLTSEATPDKLETALYKQADGTLLLKKNVTHHLTPPDVPLEPPPAIPHSLWRIYWAQFMSESVLAEFKYSKTLNTTAAETIEFDAKVTTLPQSRAYVRIPEPDLRSGEDFMKLRGYYPATTSAHVAAKPEETYNPAFLFYRGLDATGPVATSEAKRMYNLARNGDVIPAADIKIGNRIGSGADNRPSAQFALQMDGEHGIFNRFFKQWASFLQGNREIDFELGLTVNELRKFSFDKTIYIGNKSYLAKELNIELSEKGIESVKATLIPFAA